jgi:orotidine-5'-phosphate decarboxylase
VQSKLIVALDFDNHHEAISLVDQLERSYCVLKVGSELFTLLGPDFVRELVRRGFKVFLDLKFHDIPNTVARACKVAAELGVWMLNVHASGGYAMMQAARQALASYKVPPLLIAVTVLTSMSEQDLIDIGIDASLDSHVVSLAQLSQRAGLDGVVCSAQEASVIKKHCGPDFITVTPGIRLPTDSADDQSRIITPVDAIKAGSDYLVIGRPITRAADPKQVVSYVLALCNNH